jgi:hypothetical protein
MTIDYCYRAVLALRATYVVQVLTELISLSMSVLLVCHVLVRLLLLIKWTGELIINCYYCNC